MAYSITPIKEEDIKPAVDIFNYYIENSFAAYPETKIPSQAFEMMLSTSENLPTGAVKDEEGRLIGFGMLRPYHPLAAFSHTAETTYFLHPEYTGKGLGKTLLTFLQAEGRKKGITTLLANISSRNPGSVNFHAMNGFVECGRFKGIGKKNNNLFDIIWMQKKI